MDREENYLLDNKINNCLTNPNEKDLTKRLYVSDVIKMYCYQLEQELSKYKADAQLIATAPEMLEALIIDLIEDEIFYLSKGYSVDQLIEYGKDGEDEMKSFSRKKAIVEKATGKSWEEIKQIL